MIKLLIVDDYPVVLSGLVAMFKNHDDIEVVGVANNGERATELAISLRPNVVMMNLVMPGVDGIEATRLIKKSAPEVNIIIFSGINTQSSVIPALNAGAIGYILKDASEPELVQAVHQAARGEVCLHPMVVQHLVRQMHEPEEQEGLIKKLTERELSVLKLMAQGYTNQEIARLMVVSAATVHSHVGRILSKLEVSSRTQAVIYAMRAGIVDLPDD
ncbi:MAG: DNA-binding response regulator [Chloroflexi bacterium HGW-Chloroflexi-10]|nr:MAG: DNA-binding response regulator [Chloroflexi bacterium HGW-Chloroflexi-10]